MKSPLEFKIIGTFNKARTSLLTLPHGSVKLPIFMPIGTKAAMKGLLSCDLERMGCNLMLSNAYHLFLEPGDKFINENYKNVHKYMNWNKNVLTDSGGFQMVSLSDLSEQKHHNSHASASKIGENGEEKFREDQNNN